MERKLAEAIAAHEATNTEINALKNLIATRQRREAQRSVPDSRMETEMQELTVSNKTLMEDAKAKDA